MGLPHCRVGPVGTCAVGGRELGWAIRKVQTLLLPFLLLTSCFFFFFDAGHTAMGAAGRRLDLGCRGVVFGRRWRVGFSLMKPTWWIRPWLQPLRCPKEG